MRIKLSTISKKSPCHTGWKKHLESLPEYTDTKKDYTSLEAIMLSNGFLDVEWVINTCCVKLLKTDFVKRLINMVIISHADPKHKQQLQEAWKTMTLFKEPLKERTKFHTWKRFINACIKETDRWVDLEDLYDDTLLIIPEKKAKEIVVHVLKHMPTEEYYRRGITSKRYKNGSNN